MQHRAAAVCPCHLGKTQRAFESGGAVAEINEGFKITPRPATKIENRKRRRALDVLQQRVDVLAHIVVAGALPKIVSALVVVFERAFGNVVEVLRGEFHVCQGCVAAKKAKHQHWRASQRIIALKGPPMLEFIS